MTADAHGPSSEECLEIFARLSEYIDDEMEQAFRAIFEDHMGDCPPCVKFLDSLRHTVRVLEDVDAPSLPADIRRDVVEAFDRLKKESS